MKIVSTAEMRAIDRVTTARFGIPSLALMESAGSAVARFVIGEYPRAGSVGVVCGKGNNGGDGFVAARKLAEAGREVRVLVLCDPTELRGDAAAMFERMPDRVRGRILVARTPDWLDSSAAAEVFSSDVLVDAILGTGFRPPVNEIYAAAISKMNASAAAVVAVDIPSGAEADATQPQPGVMARADAIVTFTAPRPAHVFGELTGGPTVIAPLGSPEEAIASELELHLSTPADFAALLAARVLDANKGSYGHVQVIGGSLGKAGAAAMAGFSALRAGAGLSTVATPRSVLATVAGFHPELMTEPLPETEDGTISLRALEKGLALAGPKTAVAIGPGISRNQETSEFVRAMLKEGVLPSTTAVIVDADGLNAFEAAAEKLNGRGRTIVITPHPGEMARLNGLSIAQVQATRLETARQFAREHELIVVLKGHRTLIAAPGGRVWVNPTGNPGMATGGTGDVLTGIVAGLVAQHPERALEATALSVYLHGLAGDLAADALSESALVATDLVRFLPESFRRMEAEMEAGTGEFRFRA